jgi:hypothetical protein
LFWRNSPPPQWAMTAPFTRFLDHTQRRTTVGRTPLDEWSARRRDVYLTTHTQNSHETNIHTPGGNRTRNLSRRVVADLRLRPCGHWDRRLKGVHGSNTKLMTGMFNLNICLIESFYPLLKPFCWDKTLRLNNKVAFFLSFKCKYNSTNIRPAVKILIVMRRLVAVGYCLLSSQNNLKYRQNCTCAVSRSRPLPFVGRSLMLTPTVALLMGYITIPLLHVPTQIPLADFSLRFYKENPTKIYW